MRLRLLRDRTLNARIRIALVAALLACGCNGATTTPSAPSPRAVRSWASDVAPVVRARCAGCHQSGGLAPLPLLTYADAKKIGPAIRAAAVEGRMPPIAIVDTGGVSHPVAPSPLTPGEVSVIRDWVDAGMPEGAPSAPIDPPPRVRL